MTLSNKMEELLSGYLDNQLNPDELREVERSLDEPEVQAYLQQLRQNQKSLNLVAKQTQASLRPDFAKVVLERIVKDSTGTAKPAPSHLDARFFAVLATLAATLVLAFELSKDNSSTPRPSGDDSIAQQGPVDTLHPIDQPTAEPSKGQLVSRDDLKIVYLMTLDVEIPKTLTAEKTIGPLLKKHNIRLVKGARVTNEVEKALDNMRMTVDTTDLPTTTEVFLIHAESKSLDDVLESIRVDSDAFLRIRFGMAYELPTDPLLDKLSVDMQKEADALQGMLKSESAPVALAQAVANSVVDNHEVTVGASFATPLVSADKVDNDYRPSPFESIPQQGKLVSSKIRKQSAALSQQFSEDDEKSFVLLFVRQR